MEPLHFVPLTHNQQPHSIDQDTLLLNDPCFPVRVGPPKNMTGTSY